MYLISIAVQITKKELKKCMKIELGLNEHRLLYVLSLSFLVGLDLNFVINGIVISFHKIINCVKGSKNSLTIAAQRICHVYL